MKIAITGASGMIGRKLIDQFEKADYEITIFTRDPSKKLGTKTTTKTTGWNCEHEEDWTKHFERKDVIINLAGANLASRRWNENSKRIMYDSRIGCTQKLVSAISNCSNKPKTLISASAVGIYGDRGDEQLREESNPGNDFLANLCKDWEREAQKVTSFDVRCVNLRIGLVLSKDGGVLKSSLLPFKLFAGGKLGNGKQFFPWIHLDDLTGIINHVINNEMITGPLNCASPGIVREEIFAKTLGKILKRPSIFPIPRLMLKAVVGEIADAILSSQNISVQKLLNSGYDFKYVDISSALNNLLEE